jgi:macrophage erythroblast attacher
LLINSKEQPLLRLPYELARKNFKSVQRSVEKERETVLSTLKATANASMAGQDPSQTLASLDNMISRMQGLKRKIEHAHEEEKVLHEHSRARIEHLKDLYEIPSLADVKYDEWAKIRLNRLLVDYLLRSGYAESARALAEAKGIEKLVDLDVFVQCHRVEKSLKGGNTSEGLAWCAEHKPMMRKTSVCAYYSQLINVVLDMLT